MLESNEEHFKIRAPLEIYLRPRFAEHYNSAMQESDWKTLIWSLQHQNCILFLGPDIGCPTQSSSPILFTQGLTAKLASELGLTEESDLPAVADSYRKTYSTDDLQREVVEFCAAHENDQCDILADFAALPFYLVVTSCHDSLVRTAFESQRPKKPRVEAYNFKGGTPDNLDMGTVEQPLIYHLYGSPKDPRSLVLTEHDLIDFLVSIVSKDPQLPQSVSAEIRKKAKTLLFVGFGIKQWHHRILIHFLRSQDIDSRSFALDAFDEASSKALERTIFFYKSGYKLEVFQTDLPRFARELRLRFGQVPQAGPVLPSAGPSPAFPSPKVFLCYASEDRARVEEVCGQLRGAGLDAWMDQTSLQGGDHWDRVIKQQLAQADYFLVFQSHALHSKEFSYVNKEINLALERQQFARQGFRFVIPIQIDDCPVLPELQGFQAVRLTAPGNASDLASFLVRDHQLRRRA